MTSYYWLKLWYAILDDPKVNRMTERLKWRMIQLFLMAGELGADGVLPSVEDMSWRIRVPVDELETDLADLASAGIVHFKDSWTVTNYAKRQAPSTSAERMKRMRDRKKIQEYYDASDEVVTNRNADTDTDTDTDIDIDTEEVNPPSPLSDSFDTMQRLLEDKTGKPAMGEADVKTIKECISLGVTEEDVIGALQWRDEHGRGPVSTLSGLMNGLRTNVSMRLQTKSGKKLKGGRKLVAVDEIRRLNKEQEQWEAQHETTL